jgi:hypothetical protein
VIWHIRTKFSDDIRLVSAGRGPNFYPLKDMDVGEFLFVENPTSFINMKTAAYRLHGKKDKDGFNYRFSCGVVKCAMGYGIVERTN